MLLYVIKQWKEKKITVMLLILGFLVGNLVLSVGTSVAVENVKMLEDQTSGRSGSAAGNICKSRRRGSIKERRLACVLRQTYRIWGSAVVVSGASIYIGKRTDLYDRSGEL